METNRSQQSAPSLILIRHSVPILDFSVPSSTWELSDDGRRRCLDIVPTVERAEAVHIYAGPEPKMAETASIVGEHLGIAVTRIDDLSEHRRPRLPERGQEEWHALIARLFAEPEQLVLGHETANQCLDRVDAAIRRIADQHRGESFAVVSGGTAISLYVARHQKAAVFDFWQTLDMPHVVVTEHPAIMT